jgi:hemoglobin-like flavoprotein
MTPAQIRTIRSSFAEMAPVLPDVGRRFYDRLFAAAPELGALWGGDRGAQQDRFVKAVTELVHRRSSMAMPAIGGGKGGVPAAAALRRHVGAGFRPEHFDMMRVALIEALREQLGSRLTAPVQAAWEAAFDVLAKGMLDGPAKGLTADDRFFDRLAEADEAEHADAAAGSEGSALHQFFR